MDLIFARSPLLLLLVVVLAAALTWWSYSRMVPTVAGGRKALLAGLRFGTFALVLLLLFEPILQRITTRSEQPVVAVLLDDSRSLSPTDTGGAGADGLREVLASLPRMDAEIRFFRFAGDVQPWGEDSLAFDGARTDIARALDDVSRRFEHRNLRAVVLASDGRYNTGRNPLFLAERYPVPIYTITVGDTLEPADVRIGEVVTNEIAYTGVELPVRVAVRSTGYAGRQAAVTLSERGRTLARETVTLPEDGLEVAAELAFTPEEEGLRHYTAAVTHFDGEATHANNSAAFSVRVLSTRRSVLLLAAAPGPDLSAVRQELELNDDLEIVSRTPRAPGDYYEGDFPRSLDEFDLAVLVGYPGRATPPEEARMVANAAENGLPVLFLLTRQTDLQKLDATLGGALPARPEAVRPTFLEGQITVTATGASHAVLQIPGLRGLDLRRLPPVLVNESRWSLAPDARPLATTRIRGIELDDALLAVLQRGRARSASLLAAGSWRWRNLPADLEDLGGFYPGLMHNLVSWLTAAEDDRPVRVRPVQNLFDTTEPIRFTGQVYDDALQPVSDADVQVTIRTPDDTELPFPMRPLGNGRFELHAASLPEGDYTYEARAERGGVELGIDRGSFAVGTLDLELRHLTADPVIMREIAHRSGGRAAFSDDLSGVVANLSQDLVERRVASTSEVELRRLASLLALLIGLLSTEWVMRKRFGMV